MPEQVAPRTCANDGHTRDLLILVHSRQLHVGGVVSNVHQGGVHHLVVDSVLGGLSHATSTGIKVIDEERAHLALLDDVGRLPARQKDTAAFILMRGLLECNTTGEKAHKVQTKIRHTHSTH
jgi:hypothetical protein